MYLRNSYHSYFKIYTDGSKNRQEFVGIGVYVPEFKICISKRLSDQLSVYTAEIAIVGYSGLKRQDLIGWWHALVQ